MGLGHPQTGEGVSCRKNLSKCCSRGSHFHLQCQLQRSASLESCFSNRNSISALGSGRPGDSGIGVRKDLHQLWRELPEFHGPWANLHPWEERAQSAGSLTLPMGHLRQVVAIRLPRSV